MKTFRVGGCVRDALLNHPVHDVDFAVEVESFDKMREELLAQGFKIHTENPEFLTIRAGVPEGNPLRLVTKDADFVMCRKDSATSDGRRPDFVEPGTLMDDLARRDFTVNAMAFDTNGTLIDPFGGKKDLEYGLLRFVGNARQRINEDGLRVMRALRFCVTKNFGMTNETVNALRDPFAAEMLGKVSVERIQIEAEKMFAHNTIASLRILNEFHLNEAIFHSGLRLSATLKR